ncbi:MAG: DUF697 domain-containing protein [Chloroflexaceae bacterium]|nr:DUF697 domain-containing protein [Chloroflexaceae bacterium]
MHDIKLVNEVEQALFDALSKRGRVNILIAGKTGVGKSTLINAIFQGQLATTGQGRPVTQNTREITKADIPISIFDTRGLEAAAFEETLDALEKLITLRRKNPDPQHHIHVAWVCIAEDLRRVEEAESRLVTMLARYIPVIGVITKARADQGFRAIVQELLPDARNVVRVRSIPEELDDGYMLKPMGLQQLVDVTMEVVPESQQNAFTAAQKVDMELKKRRSHLVVGSAATASAAAGATPIPFADAAIIVPIQVGMLAQITAIFGVPLTKGFLTTLIASVITGSGATMAGRTIAAGLLKLVPGAGTAAGATISATTAMAVTTAFGETYIFTLSKLFDETRGEPPSDEEIIKRFRDELRGRQ